MFSRRRWIRLGGGLALLFGLNGCVTPGAGSGTRPTTESIARPDPAATLSPADHARALEMCPEGLPRYGGGPADPTVLLVHATFAALESTTEKVPVWVCERLEAEQLKGKVPRPPSTAFQPDPALPPGQRAELRDYAGSGYDRGHMAPAGDETTTESLKRDTFSLSNMAPQAGALNRQIWAKLEEVVRLWALQRGPVHVVTGPLFLDASTGEGPATPSKTIGPDAVAVPTHFFKVVVVDAPGAPVQAIAFVLENRGYDPPWDFPALEKPIRWIESHSAIDFMPELSAADADRVETTVPALWSAPSP